MIVDWVVCDGCGKSGGRAPFDEWRREGSAHRCDDCQAKAEAALLERRAIAKAEAEADAIADKARAEYLAAWHAARAVAPAAEPG